MLTFNLSTHRVMVDAKSLMIRELNDIYYGTEDKGYATDVLSYIHLVSQIDADAPYFSAREDEVTELVARDIWGKDYTHKVDVSTFDDCVAAYLTAFDKPEYRMLRVFNTKIDQFQTMLEDTKPEIEKSINMKTGTFTFASNTRAMTQVMKEINNLIDERDALLERIKQTQTKEAKVWGGRKQSILDKKRMAEATRMERRKGNETSQSPVEQSQAGEGVPSPLGKGVGKEESPVPKVEEGALSHWSNGRGI